MFDKLTIGTITRLTKLGKVMKEEREFRNIVGICAVLITCILFYKDVRLILTSQVGRCVRWAQRLTLLRRAIPTKGII